VFNLEKYKKGDLKEELRKTERDKVLKVNVKKELELNLKEFVRHQDCVLRISLPARMEEQEEPKPEENVD
jgi:hypothetical protein